MPERFDLEELVAEVLERYQAEARAAGCELRRRPPLDSGGRGTGFGWTRPWRR